MSNFIRTATNVRNVRWGDPANTRIEMDVFFLELNEEVPFTAVANDCEPHGVDLFNRAIQGEFGEIGEFTPPDDFTAEQSLGFLRERRNELLQESDYIEVPSVWNTLSEAQQNSWTEYRSALRNLPQDYPDAYIGWSDDYESRQWKNIVWPTKPS